MAERALTLSVRSSATKTYLNSLGAMALLFSASAADAAARAELEALPEALEKQMAVP